MHDYAFVPTTFGDRLFQIRRIGESDKTTLLAKLDDEDKAWMENEMKKCPTRGKKSWFSVPINILAWLVFKVCKILKVCKIYLIMRNMFNVCKSNFVIKWTL